MSIYMDAATYANDPVLAAPLTAAIVATAISISYEDDETPGHLLRKTLATRVLDHPDGLVRTFAWATSSNATVVSKWISEDHDGALGDLAFVLASVWDAVAGV